jgi:hypothetical protein
VSSRWPKQHQPSRPDSFVRLGVSPAFWRGLAGTIVIYTLAAAVVAGMVAWAR